MKNLMPRNFWILSFMLLVLNAAWGQSRSLQWQTLSEESFNRPWFESADQNPHYPDLPCFCGQELKPEPYQVLKEIKVLTSQVLKGDELRLVKSQHAEAITPEVLHSRFLAKSPRRVSYCFDPYFQKNGVWHKIISYDLIFQSDSIPSAIASLSSKRLQTSKLATGDWFKLQVEESGMYKITPAFLSENGITTDPVAISDLRVLGNGGGMLPESMTQARPSDLIDQALHKVDLNNDGIFNGNDYILFFGEGPHQWNYNSTFDRFDYRHNIYRDYNYYFLSVNAGPGQAPAPANNPTVAQIQTTTYDALVAQEDDQTNLVGTGRQWFGDIFEFTLSYNYSFTIPNLVSSEPVGLLVDLVGRVSTSGTSVRTNYAGQTLLNNGIQAYPTFGSYPAFVQRSSQRTSFTAQNGAITLNLTYDNSSNPSGVVWLDKIVLNARAALAFGGGLPRQQLIFRDSRSVATGQNVSFTLSQVGSEVQVWALKDDGTQELQSGNFDGQGNYTFIAPADELREYIAFQGGNFPSPAFVGQIPNQDLHALEVPEMIIISHPNFTEPAQELAEFHTNDRVISTVVTTEQIYNEYGSGGQDITAIRDFIKDLYDRSRGAARPLQYVLLFGDASYDYKDRLANNNNYVPTWQSDFSFSLGSSSITDDFFAYMDPGEGTNFGGADMDLGVGRLPVENLAQANSYVAKIKRYVAGEGRFNDWRNRLLLMTDDVDESWERSYFVPTSERLANQALNASGAFNIEKIYLDAYQQETTTGSQSYPEARRDMFRKVQQGVLLVNYIGHGGEIGLASERLLQLSDVNGWTNSDALSLFITITCEFTRYDDPKRVSAGEQLILNPNGGAIALLSTTRVVLVQPAVELNESIFDTILSRSNGVPQTLGEIIRAAKNGPDVINNFTKTKFSLIGDPALRLAIPEFEVRPELINGQPIANVANDTIEALSLVRMSGSLRDLNGQKMSDFNGILRASIFDKPTQRQTLVNDGIGAPVGFLEQNNLIYRGKVAVENGEFELEFRVPLGINYQIGSGKASFYAYDETGDRDAAGFNDDLLIGGFDQNAPQDEQGPEIDLFMNNPSFVRGGITGENPFIFARLRDSSGINTVGSGIGQDLRAVLNERSDQPYILNEFYEADLNSYQSGELRYQLFDLEPGNYQLTLRAFDIYNNPSEETTDFVVAESADLALDRVLNYPNPFTTYTEFQFEHNRANQLLEVQVQIFTVSGRLVKTINSEVFSDGNRVTGIAWDGLDDFGDPIGKGVYVYRLKVRSGLDNSSADQYEKLVILR